MVVDVTYNSANYCRCDLHETPGGDLHQKLEEILVNREELESIGVETPGEVGLLPIRGGEWRSRIPRSFINEVDTPLFQSS